jgi:hypothetical protein
MQPTKKSENYLPHFQDDSGKIYQLRRVVTEKEVPGELLSGDNIWIPVKTVYLGEDDIEAITDDGEDTFTLQTEPRIIIRRVTPRI